MSVTINFMVMGESGEPVVARGPVQWDAVPRVGERVFMRGPEFGDRGAAQWRETGIDGVIRMVGESIFNVFEVDWQDNGSVEVMLSVPPVK